MIQFNIHDENILKDVIKAAALFNPVVSIKDSYDHLYVGHLTGIGGFDNTAVTFERWVGPDIRYYSIPLKYVVRMNILSQKKSSTETATEVSKP